jgi:2-aminoethylphosphonate-pyruvate transaminase
VPRGGAVDDDIPYLLLTPGPLTTTRSVREAMLRDYSTWDVDYCAIVQGIRHKLVALASERAAAWTAVLMQGSGTFAIEATIGSVVPPDGKVLTIENGAYGARIGQIVDRLGIARRTLQRAETEPFELGAVRDALESDAAITHVVVVHCETTTGMLNDARGVGALVGEFGKTFVLDAMSSFGGVEFRIEDVGAHYLVSSSNKCIQGVPGFGFVIADRARLEETEGRARSLSLDLFAQWRGMEDGGGKWRYTSPTHAVCAFAQALVELEDEGGVAARERRYADNQRRLVAGMTQAGFRCLLPRELQSPIITSFLDPSDARYEWRRFYDALKARRFVIYPGKVTAAGTFRIGTIGNVFPDDVARLVAAVEDVVEELGWTI